MSDSTTNSFGKPVPVFHVANVRASVKYYDEALGFSVAPWSDDLFASVARGDCNLFLTSDKQSQPRMWIYVGVPDAPRRVRAFRRKVRNPPNNFEWVVMTSRK